MRSRILFFLLIISLSIIVIQCGQGGPKPDGEKADTEQDSSKAGQDSSKAEADSLEKAKKDSTEKAEAESEMVPVEVTTIGLGDISNFILLNSNLETEIMADVYSRIQGIVESIDSEEGQVVKKGQLMMKLEAREYELAEKKAKIELDKQQINFNRMKGMHDKNLLSEDEFENARFALESVRVQWEEAKLNLGYTEIRSPISGAVGDRLAKIGRRIQPTDKLFSVVNTSQVIAVVYVPEKNLGQISKGQRAVVFSDNLKDIKFDGWIKRISPVVDPSSGTFKVTVGVKNAGKKLRPGMFVNIQIIIDTHKDVVLIPKTAVVYENEYKSVYIVRDGIAHKINLTEGFSDNEKLESMKDIEDGEQIIVVGQAGMKDKTKVRIVNERPNPIAAKNK